MANQLSQLAFLMGEILSPQPSNNPRLNALKKEVSNPILQMEIDRSIRDIYNRLETDELKECCVRTIGKAYHTIFITGLREARPVLTR